jgi:hypothetical protein
VDERLGRGHGGFVVVAEAAVAAEPGEGPLDTPQRLERDEPVGPRGTSPDVDRDAEFFTGTGDQADVCGVGEHLGEPDELRFRGFEEGPAAARVVRLGTGDADRDGQAVDVGEQVPFPATDAFAAVCSDTFAGPMRPEAPTGRREEPRTVAEPARPLRGTCAANAP